MAQRSRWLTGYLQTWLVVMRHPWTGIGELSLVGVLSIQLTLESALLSALVHSPWALWLLASLVFPALAPWPVFLSVAGASCLSGLLLALAAQGRAGPGRLLLALSQPFYWPPQTLAMARALYGLLRRPHYWAKTPHGLAAPRQETQGTGHSASKTFSLRSCRVLVAARRRSDAA